MIEYRTDASLEASALADLFRRSGIRRPVDDLPRIARMIAHANLVITAWSGDRLVGVARSLTDFGYCCYLSDLAVDRDFQRAGIGKELLRLTKEAIGAETTLLLLAAPEAMKQFHNVLATIAKQARAMKPA
jgi:GNAT superfamily N-acetyltransferase